MKKKNKTDFFADHKKPVTRRDFLARGSLSFSATVFAPTLLSSLFRSRKVMAASPSASPYIPFLVFDCNGGASMPGNFLVGGAGGPQDLLPSYNLLGWNPRAAGAVDTRFGLPMAAKASQILAGILATTSPAAQANLRMGSFAHFGQDDSSTNNISALVLAIEMGATGSIVNRGFGTQPTLSGGNSNAVDQDASFQPIIVQSINDVLNSLSFGPSLDQLSASSRRAIVKAALTMSVEQLNKLSAGNPGAFGNQMGAAFQSAMGYTTAGAQLDPRSDAQISALYKINSQTDVADPNLISAAIAMNVLKGQSGPGVITINGCDYHDGTQTTGDAIDLQIGTQIGLAVEAAHLLNTPFFFQVLTDGGIFAQTDTRNWTGDAGDKSMTIVGYYNPASVPQLINPHSPQIGAFNAGQGADQNTLVGSDTGKVCYGVLANYLQVCGQLGANADTFNSVFGTGVVDQVLLFGG
jgi:hypothetical protein